MTRLTRVIRGLGYVAATLVILTALAVSVSRLLTPFLNDHLPNFEKWSSQILDTPVKIGLVHLSWEVYEPVIAFDRVELLDKKTNKPIFFIQNIKINLNIFRSILALQPLPERIDVSGVNLTVRQPMSGQFNIEELKTFSLTDETTKTLSSANDVLAWIFSQSNLVLRNINIAYHPFSGEQQSIRLEHLILRNGTHRHQLDGQAILLQQHPTRAQLHLKWAGDITDLSHVTAHLYLYLEGIDLPQWLSQYSWRNLTVREGVGSVKLWAKWQNNQWQKIQTQLQLYDLELQSSATKKSQYFPRFSGHFGWMKSGENQIFAGENVLIDLPYHLWPTTAFSFTVKPLAEGSYALLKGHLDYIHLKDSTRLLSDLGLLPTSVQSLWTTINPQGEIRDLFLQIPLELTLENIFLTGSFSHLSLNNWKNFPGVVNAAGAIKWNGRQGDATLNNYNMKVLYPSIFADSLLFEQLTGLLHWEKTAENAWLLSAKKLHAKNPDMSADAELEMKFLEGDSPTVNLTGDFNVTKGENISLYLPLKIFDQDLQIWLRHAIQRGEVKSGHVVLQGRWADFPYGQDNGKFVVTSRVHDVSLQYAPGWPSLQHVDGLLTFAGRSMSVDVSSAQIFNIPIPPVHAEIPYIGDSAPQFVNVRTSAIPMDLSQAQRFIHESPLQKTIGKNLANIKLNGPMQLKLDLSVPLAKPEETKVQGDVTVKEGSMMLPEWNILYDRLEGRFRFTEKEIVSDDLKGRLFNEPATLTLATVNEKGHSYVKANVQSQVSIAEIQAWLKTSLSGILEGHAVYQAELHLPSGQQPVQLMITSDLRGIAFNVPEPFRKKSSEVRNLQCTFTQRSNKTWDAKVQYSHSLFRVTKNPASWLINVNNNQMAGELTIANNFATISGKFERLYLVPAKDVQNTPLNPKNVPALAITVQDARYNNVKFGHLTLETERGLRGLMLKKLQLDMPYSKLSATGIWQSNHSHVDGILSTSNVSNMLNEWEIKASALVGGKGQIKFGLDWPGPLYAPDVSALSGQLSLDLGAGRIINLGDSTDAKLGMGRLLNLLSLQAIPRNLSNLGNLFEKGYSFDSVKGDFELSKGDAYTNSTKIEGQIARVDMSGRIGIKNKDYDLKLSVTPFVSTPVPMVAAAVATPLAGVAAWVVEKVVGSAVSQAAAHHYKITGTWDAPNWQDAK